MMLAAIWVLIIGAILLFLGGTKKAGTYSNLAVIVGVVMLVAGAFWPGYGVWEGEMQITDTDIGLENLDITMANGSWDTADITGTADADDTGVTYQLNQDGTHTFDQTYLSANFSFSPVAPEGADDTDLITVYFSIPGNDEIDYDGDEIWDETSNIEDIDWFHNGIASGSDKDVEGTSGSITMKYTDSDYLTFTAELTSGSADTFAENMDTVGESYTVPITFEYGGNSETFDVNFVVITNA